MNRTHLLTVLATASLVVGGQAIAQGRGGGHGGGHGVGAGVGVGVGVGHGNGGIGVQTRTDARINSQGPSHANVRARARANDNSVLARGRAAADLTALRSGLVVRNANGVTLGTVYRVNRASDGRIVNVLVRDRANTRRTFPVAPTTLSVTGDVVTTSLIRLHR